MSTLKQQILRYWLAMNASALDACVHSLVAFYGVAGVHALAESVPALNWQQLLAVLLVSFGRGILSYLDSHPVSAMVPIKQIAVPQTNEGEEKGTT